MDAYRRPVIEVLGVPLADAPGAVGSEAGGGVDAVPYGRRWAGGSPPEEAYSRTEQPERFAPLHEVARALVDWLVGAFELTVESGPDVVVDLLLPAPSEVVHAVRVTPVDRRCAPMTVVLTPFPGVMLHAGALQDFAWPFCGCDACDDDVLDLVTDLEWVMRTVVSGGFHEWLDAPAPPARSHPADRALTRDGNRGIVVEYRLDDPGVASRSARTPAAEFPDARLAAAR
ncbi:MAG: DUF6226 family protein, partial [Herbiconiux sp.]|nr:DUF6226 family protein [Herbiconiux sp.]